MMHQLQIRTGFIGLLFLLFSGHVIGASNGMTGYSGNPNTANGDFLCSLCHNSGITPTVTISGPNNASPDSTSSFSITVSGGQQLLGGLNISASSGTLLVQGADTSIKKIGLELTHSQPAPDIAGSIVWNFDWQAPATPGTYTLYAAGVSADDDKSVAGDSAAIDSFTITVASSGPTPVARISSPQTARLNTSVTFDGSASSAPSPETINQYDWNIDGIDFLNSGDNHIATFTTLGRHTATLTVTDSNSVSATTFADIIIADTVIPVVNHTGPYTADTGIAISLDASASLVDSSTALTNFVWDFGDGSVIEQGPSPTITHAYATTGTYTLTIAAQDGNGMTGVAATTVTVNTPPQPATGEEIYNTQCLACHGVVGAGTPAIPKIIEGATDALIFNAIAIEPAMNGIVLSGAEALLIEDYLAVTGSTGDAMYRNRCQICHGIDGVGIAGTAPPVIGATSVMVLDKIASIPSMNGINLLGSEIQLIADYLGSGAATTGSEYYEVKCAICHGATGTGITGVGPAVKGATQSMITGAVNSVGIMDNIILPADSAQLIADYLGTGGSSGQEFYNNKCTICHGGAGIGGIAPFVKGATQIMIKSEIRNVSEMNGILASNQESQLMADFLGSGGSTGEDFYTNKCLICHGPNGTGSSGPFDGGSITGKSASKFIDAIDDKDEMAGILLNNSEALAIESFLNGG